MNANKGNIRLSQNEKKNTLTYNNVDYLIKPLNPLFPYSAGKGGNSNIFILQDSQTDKEFILKLSKYDLRKRQIVLKFANRIGRFEREIEALRLAQTESFQFVINIAFDGEFEIGNQLFRYFVMEKAESDLTDFLKTNEVSIQQRFLTCTEILNGIKELHSIDIYHRDIKPDNILFVNGTWKISDLGLIGHRDDDFKSNEIGEKIGPANWMAPEAFNKMYNEGDGCLNAHKFDCDLDDKTDIFQLGKLFWFIFQGNLPEGQLLRDDFKIEDDEIFKLIYDMLSHSKVRPEINVIDSEFKKKYSTYQI